MDLDKDSKINDEDFHKAFFEDVIDINPILKRLKELFLNKSAD